MTLGRLGPAFQSRFYCCAAGVSLAFSSFGKMSCAALFVREPPPRAYASLVHAEATTLDGKRLAQGCETGALSALAGEERSLGARVLRVPATPGMRIRLTLRFEDIEKHPDAIDHAEGDRSYCSPAGVTKRESRLERAGCHAALRVVGTDPPAEITRAQPIVERDGESGVILDVTIRHAGVLRVRPERPCPVTGDFGLLTIGEPTTNTVAR